MDHQGSVTGMKNQALGTFQYGDREKSDRELQNAGVGRKTGMNLTGNQHHVKRMMLKRTGNQGVNCQKQRGYPCGNCRGPDHREPGPGCGD